MHTRPYYSRCSDYINYMRLKARSWNIVTLSLSLSLFLSSSLSLSLDFLRNVTWKIRTSELFYYYYLFNNFIIIFYYFGRLMCGNKYRLWVFTLFREYKYTRKRFNHWNNSLVWFHFCYWIYKNMNLHEHGLIIIHVNVYTELCWMRIWYAKMCEMSKD